MTHDPPRARRLRALLPMAVCTLPALILLAVIIVRSMG